MATMSDARKRSVFGQIFDGPDSLFGTIFGESEAVTPAIRITLSSQHMADLASGKTLLYKAGNQNIRITPPVDTNSHG